jgi:drug/metabolite transporter (DMT)-like permease
LASRYSSVLASIVASQAIGLGLTVALLLPSGEQLPPLEAQAWAVAAGFSGVAGLGCFYLALSRGTMGLVAPLAALLGASLPALLSIIAGEHLDDLRLLGIVLALIAVVLISLPVGERTAAERRAVRIDLRELPMVLGAGLGFAGFFLFLDRSTAAGAETWWPIAVVRVAGLAAVLAAIILLLFRDRRRPLRARAEHLLGIERARHLRVGVLSLLPLYLLAGFGDLGGNAFFILANSLDALPVAVVLSSLYPVVTTLLAAVFLHERLRPHQFLGIALAVGAVVLIGR